MADVNSRFSALTPRPRPAADLPAPGGADTSARPVPAGGGGVRHYDLIELLFFAYRDFVGDADAELADYGFGRAHHRVLHFVDRHPGLSVQDLLEILRITKQSLARVLRELVEQGFVIQREGVSDRRQRLLSTTPRGEALARRLAALQASRIERALGEIGPEAGEAARAFLTAMIDEAARSGVIRLMAKAPPGGAA